MIDVHMLNSLWHLQRKNHILRYTCGTVGSSDTHKVVFETRSHLAHAKAFSSVQFEQEGGDKDVSSWVRQIEHWDRVFSFPPIFDPSPGRWRALT
jgi:hypothetical protein